MENLKKKYRDLETRVYNVLRNEIAKSDYMSKYVNEKAIKVNGFGGDYEELTIVNDKLTLINMHGCHYSVCSENLESLIDILY